MDFEQGAGLLSRLLKLANAETSLRDLLQALGGWHGAFAAGPEPFVGVLGEGQRGQVEALFELVETWLEVEVLAPVVTGTTALAEALRPRLALEPVESFWVVSLDARARITGLERISMGTLTACLVHPREVFAPALRARAASVVVLHNHPSGDPEPSPEDYRLTERLETAGRLLGMPLVDHVVVARSGVRSLMEGALSTAFGGP